MGQEVDNRVAAESTVESGEAGASNLLQAAPKIDKDKGMSDLAQVAVPKRIVLDAPVGTADNVEEHLPLGFES